MLVKREWTLLALLLTAPMTAVAGNVVTDWDAKAVGIVQTGTAPPPPLGFRTMAILHSAMFDAMNSIELRYKPYKVRLVATPDTSKEAAAAAAAAAVLSKLFPDAAADVQSTLTSYLVCRLSNRVAFRLSDGERRSGGVDLAQDVFALGFPHVAPGILIARRQEGDGTPSRRPGGCWRARSITLSARSSPSRPACSSQV